MDLQGVEALLLRCSRVNYDTRLKICRRKLRKSLPLFLLFARQPLASIINNFICLVFLIKLSYLLLCLSILVFSTEIFVYL